MNITNKKFIRPSWDKYFLNIALLTSERSNCIKRKVGCIIVKNNRILSLGYNGTPMNTLNCYEGGCQRCCNIENTSAMNLDLCMCLHAEENAILFVSKEDLQDSTMYVTLIPCISCVKKILQCGIKKVMYINNYLPEIDIKSREILEKNNVKIEQWDEKIENLIIN
jgi:dCMP deaminase